MEIGRFSERAGEGEGERKVSGEEQKEEVKERGKGHIEEGKDEGDRQP
jgi:hypothetical protein